ncbi:Cullin-9 [Seminavis robusta]|uniref:RBR-type E3 ubiquitin transferase n=1 Tax=Seminavis robusta TaxID=568900 RepID=A0A9N8DJU2_9STRA|nr:Cullin-9 [Seminavis robusta]|eukprot:Sro183_g079580.1 Cullin-9 (602) ;mRNA; f:13900-15705
MESNQSPGTWTAQDVQSWAAQAKLSQDTIAALLENQVDGPTLVTLSKIELRSELGITSLPARRYLWDLIKNLKEEQESRDYSVAIMAHQEEIRAFSSSTPPTTTTTIPEGPDAASGGASASFSAVVQELVIDAHRQRQVVEDHLLAHRMQRALKIGQEFYEDAEVAREEQERLNQLFAQAESDLQYAQTLAPPGQQVRDRTRHMEQVRPATASMPTINDDHLQEEDQQAVQRVSSLFGLSIHACSSNKINVAEAFRTGKIKPIPQPSIVSDDDEEEEEDEEDTDEEEDDRKPPAAVAKHEATLPFVRQCNVCFEDQVKGYTLACGHRQCTRCTKKLFKTALKDNSLLPLRCCEIPIDMNISSQILKPQDAARILKRVAEIEATNKMYCPSCNEFLNLDLIDTFFTHDLICSCGIALCTVCKTEAHSGFTCQENQAIKKGSDELVLQVSREKGWKQCPGCSNLIELRSGCNHMTCVYCRHEFCYNCLKSWDTRNAQCSSGQCELWEEDRLLEAGEARVRQEEAARGRVLPVVARRELLRNAVEGLRANEVCIHDWRRSAGYKGDCPNCGYAMWVYGMRCASDCGSTVCYTCAHHRIPQRGWR